MEAVCPGCGEQQGTLSRKWRFVPAPNGGVWACACGAVWTVPQFTDLPKVAYLLGSSEVHEAEEAS